MAIRTYFNRAIVQVPRTLAATFRKHDHLLTSFQPVYGSQPNNKKFTATPIANLDFLANLAKVDDSDDLNPPESKRKLIWALLLLGTLALSDKVHASETSDEEHESIDGLLGKLPEKRTIEEKLEIFHYLVRVGKEEAKKAKGKDIVMFFGAAGAGKSTLINFLCGCEMELTNGEIKISSKSKIREVVTTGDKYASCTLTPKIVPHDFLEKEYGEESDVKKRLYFCDMPGLQEETRGIEVALAHAIVMQEMTEQASSVKFVMLYEYDSFAGKGEKWKENVKLLDQRFSGSLGKKENSLFVIITKTTADREAEMKKDIQEFSQRESIKNLSQFITTYDPLKHRDRIRIRNKILNNLDAHKKLGTKISMSSGQLWKIKTEIGDAISTKVTLHLNSGSSEDIRKAGKCLQFTHILAQQDGEGLAVPHKDTTRAVENYIRTVIGDLQPQVSGSDSQYTSVNQGQIRAHKRYLFVREELGTFMDFSELNREANKSIRLTKDDRNAEWSTPWPSLYGLSTAALSILANQGIKSLPDEITSKLPPIGGIPLISIINLLTAASSVASSVFSVFYAGRRWLLPCAQEKEVDSFYKGV